MTQHATRTHRREPTGIRHEPSFALPVLAVLVGGAVVTVGLWWVNTPAVPHTLAGWLVGAGRLTGLLAGYVIALVVALMARVPVLERRVGSDRVARWHAACGRYGLGLVAAHVVLVLTGYAAESAGGLPRLGEVVDQALSVLLRYPHMLAAAAGTALLGVVGVTSALRVRPRLRYEVWYHLHLLTYAAVFLAFWHQVANGAEFVGAPVARAAWFVLYGGVSLLLVRYRILAPVRLNLRHRLRVEDVLVEAPGVVSVVMRGRDLHRLGASAGQFLRWRFLQEGLWWSANPYSLSAAPRRDLLRVTVKEVGDHSGALLGLRRGTRVWAEGPYGALTAGRRRRPKVLLLAAGSGVTPLRALFESLPARPGDLTMLYRASRTDDLALWPELRAIAAHRGARLFHAVNGPNGERAEITVADLRRLMPDVADHDVYLCGPPGFTEAMLLVLQNAGVPQRQIHHEEFGR